MTWRKKKNTAPITLTRPAHCPAGPGIHSLFIAISPDLAQKYLAHNVKNRSLMEDTANAYARDMKSGNWRQTHQGIAFNDAFELIDGQHRLEAIIRAGVTITILVTFNLPKQVAEDGGTIMDTVDRGVSRTVAQVLTLQHGISKSSTLAAVATVIGNLCYRGRLRKATVPQVIGVMQLYAEPMQWIIDRRLSGDKGLCTSHVMGALAFARAARPDDTEIFYNEFATGRAGEDSHASQLRHFLLGHGAHALLTGNSSGRVVLAEITLHAIYKNIEGLSGKLRLADDGRQYFVGLQKASAEKVKALFELETCYRGKDAELPPPSDKEKSYAELRAGMNIGAEQLQED